MHVRLNASSGSIFPRICSNVRRPCSLKASLKAAQPMSLDVKLNPTLLSTASGPGVYAVYDAGDQLQYIGVSRDVIKSIRAHAALLPELAHTARTELLPPGAGKTALQLAWKEWVVEHGSIPAGNAAGADARWTATGAAASARAAPAVATVKRSVEPQEWACAAAEAAVTEEAYALLCSQGYVVLDGAFSDELATQARTAADLMFVAGRLRDIPSQVPLGRTDESLVMDVTRDGQLLMQMGRPNVREEIDPVATSAMTHLAGLLKGVPAALQLRADSSGSTFLPRLAPPQSLQLAVYPGAGTRYARHIDNHSRPVTAADGPAGQRVSDRCITCIAYFNPSDWTEADGGYLRIFAPEGSSLKNPWEDVAPMPGRLVLFQSALVEHEVLPASRRRWALSAWVPRRDVFDE